MAIDLNKSRDFFNPDKVERMCHIIGCGSVGSNVAELLARYGIKDMTFWDFDHVESHNIANQIFYDDQINMPKVEALRDICSFVNRENNIRLKPEGWSEGDRLSGYVFLCVDNIEVRKAIVENNMMNRAIEAMFDFRTTLMEAQNYFTDWSEKKNREELLATMNFDHTEAVENTPVSACGFELSVSPVVKTAAINGICMFTNYINKKEVPKIVISNPYDFNTLALK